MHPKSFKQRKYANNKVDNEEPTVTDDPVLKETSYFEIFECGKNILNKIDTTCERACMVNPRYKY